MVVCTDKACSDPSDYISSRNACKPYARAGRKVCHGARLRTGYLSLQEKEFSFVDEYPGATRAIPRFTTCGASLFHQVYAPYDTRSCIRFLPFNRRTFSIPLRLRLLALRAAHSLSWLGPSYRIANS